MDLCFLCALTDGAVRPRDHEGRHGAEPEPELLDTQCDVEGHDPETEDIGDGVTGLGRTHEYVTTCRRCGVGLHAEQDEDGETFWEVD